MRLFGVEPHPTAAGTALRTYVCERCDRVQTATTPGRSRSSAEGRRAAAPQISLSSNNAFDDETTSALGAAYEQAWQKLKASGSVLADKSHAAATRERLAKCILEMGQRGETDPDRLVDRALVRLASPNGAGGRFFRQ